jgi:replicative DNA helicase
MSRRRQEEDEFQTSAFRVPPQAIEVEKHVIGALFLDAEAIDEASPILKPSDFYLEKHQIVYAAVMELTEKRMHVDLISVAEHLKKTRRWEFIGDAFLMEISSEVVSSANVIQHCGIIKDKSISRRVIQSATKLLEHAYGGELEGRDLIDFSEEEIYKIGDENRGRRRGLMNAQEMVLGFSQVLDQRAAGVSDRTRLGIPAIDDVMGGLRNGALNVLAARPGFGKSALALQAAVQCGEHVPFFSLEMLYEEEMERLMGQLDPNLNADGVATQAMVLAKRPFIEQVLKKIAEYKIHVCDESRVTTSYVMSECRRLMRKYGRLGMIVTDYLQMMEAVGNHKRRDLEVGQISTGLKQIGSDLRTPVLAVASLSRKPEERDNKRPIDSDLRDAGQIESDAHGIIFLYRHSKYNAAAKKDPTICNFTEAIISKNRGGPTGRTLMDFNGARSWFYGVSEADHKYYANFLKGLEFTGEDGSAPAGGGKGGKGQGKAAKGAPGHPYPNPSLLEMSGGDGGDF